MTKPYYEEIDPVDNNFEWTSYGLDFHWQPNLDDMRDVVLMLRLRKLQKRVFSATIPPELGNVFLDKN